MIHLFNAGIAMLPPLFIEVTQAGTFVGHPISCAMLFVCLAILSFVLSRLQIPTDSDRSPAPRRLPLCSRRRRHHLFLLRDGTCTLAEGRQERH